MDRWLDVFQESNAAGWTILTLLVMATVLAMFQEHLRRRFWKPNPGPPKNSEVLSVSEIVSPRRTYEMIEPIGSGDLCEVHRAKSGEAEYVLKITDVRSGKRLMANEFSLLQHLEKQSSEKVYRQYFPQPVELFPHKRGLVNVSTWREGFYSAEQILDRHHRGLDGRHLGWMFNRVLEALGFVHEQGYVHGAVLPPHLLFHPENHGLLVVGWIHAEKANTSLKLVPERFKDWYPPECKKKHPATPSVDIYLAAKSLIYLAGGDPVLNLMPEHVPPAIERFVKGCLLESPTMRSQSAWNVRQEFGAILEGLYGPPAFHPLDMS